MILNNPKLIWNKKLNIKETILFSKKKYNILIKNINKIVKLRTNKHLNKAEIIKNLHMIHVMIYNYKIIKTLIIKVKTIIKSKLSIPIYNKPIMSMDYF